MSKEQQFTYQTAEISADKLGDFVFDVRSVIVELVLFESLEKPYMSGQVAISDDQGIFDGLQFTGTERLHIKMNSDFSPSDKEGNPTPVMDRSFIMSGIDTIVKSSNSGNSSIYVVNIIDEHAYINKSKKISRAVSDNILLEVSKLCSNDVGKELDFSYLSQISTDDALTKAAQNGFKGIIPYMHPLEAATWLLQKATTPLGMPFFLYASMHDTRLRIASLESMLSQPAWNAKKPYIFSPSNVQKQEEKGDPLFQYLIVQTMKSTKLQNTMQQLMTGSIGSLYNVTDINTGRTTSTHHNFYRSLVEADVEGIIDITKQNLIDPEYLTPEIDTVSLASSSLQESSSEIFHDVVSRGVYGRRKSLHDQVTPEMFLKKIQNLAYRNAMYKNLFDVTVPGSLFITSGGSVGDKVRIEVLSDNNDPDGLQKLDKLRSGDFLVMNTRHTFRDTRHDVAMTVMKMERGPAS